MSERLLAVHGLERSCTLVGPPTTELQIARMKDSEGFYLISSSFKSKVSSEFAGIPGGDLLPYAR